jgi:hypothetical protein
VTVGCQSNGRRASSMSDLLAPTAKASAGGTACSRPPVSGCAAAQASPRPPTPTAGQAIPLLTHTSFYSPATHASHRIRTSQPSYSPQRGHPLMWLHRVRVLALLGLVIVHGIGALGAAWSTWSTNDSSRSDRWTSIQRPSCFFNL